MMNVSTHITREVFNQLIDPKQENTVYSSLHKTTGQMNVADTLSNKDTRRKKMLEYMYTCKEICKNLQTQRYRTCVLI